MSPSRSEERVGGEEMRAEDNGTPRMLTPREAADIAGELGEEDFETRLESLCVKWVADEAERTPDMSTPLKEAWPSFFEWANGIGEPGWTQAAFRTALERAGFHVKDERLRRNAIQGLRLKSKQK